MFTLLFIIFISKNILFSRGRGKKRRKRKETKREGKIKIKGGIVERKINYRKENKAGKEERKGVVEKKVKKERRK